MKVAIIGCGKIGGGIAKQLAKEHELFLFDHHKKELEGTWCSSGKQAVQSSEVIFLCVKPQELNLLAKQLQDSLQGKRVISVLAGVTTDQLHQVFPQAHIVRIMPNIALEYGMGTIGIVDNQSFTKQERENLEALLKPLGFLHWLPEKLIDSFTSLCGSAPAFIFLLIEAFTEGGILLGIEPKLGLKLTCEMMQGALATLESSKKLPGELKWEVASPGGTTIAGLKTMEDEGIRAGIINALIATYERAKGL